MRKMIWKAVIMGLLVLGIANRSEAGFISRTAEIRGKVIDATTGEPIEKVIVTASWWKNVPFIVDSSNKVFYRYVTVTDKEGNYRIPKKTSWHFPRLLAMMGSVFGVMEFRTCHPLYMSRDYSVWGKGLSGSEDIDSHQQDGVEYKEQLFAGERYYVVNVKPSSDGVIHYDIRLMGVEEAIEREAEKYRKTGQGGFNFGSFMDTYGVGFLTEHWDKEFVENVIEEWELIADPNNGFEQDVLKRKKEEILKAYQRGNGK